MLIMSAGNPSTPIIMTNQKTIQRQVQNILYSFNNITYTVINNSNATKHSAYQWERLLAISLFLNLPYDAPKKVAK